MAVKDGDFSLQQQLLAAGPFQAAARAVRPLDSSAVGAALARHERLLKPPGSLGRLEQLGAQLAGLAGVVPPPVPRPAAVAVFAGDHGVVAQGVTPWPQSVTAAMVSGFCAGRAAVNVLARQAGASVVVVDVGVATELPAHPSLRRHKVRAGTADLATGPAMTTADAAAALDIGASIATALVAAGARCLVTGDMGIGNTTPSAALVSAFTGAAPAAVTGRGTGIDDTSLERKAAVVTAAVQRARALHREAPLAVAAEVGGLEHLAIAGFVVGGAAARVPVVVDGVIALAGLLVAHALVPDCLGAVVAGHRSTEPGASVALAHLALEPLLDLGLRLGEGTGACLALPLLEAAARVLADMGTLDDAGIAPG